MSQCVRHAKYYFIESDLIWSMTLVRTFSGGTVTVQIVLHYQSLQMHSSTVWEKRLLLDEARLLKSRKVWNIFVCCTLGITIFGMLLTQSNLCQFVVVKVPILESTTAKYEKYICICLYLYWWVRSCFSRLLSSITNR